MTAQLDMWVAVHRGDLGPVGDDLERAEADIAVARAMWHRRRASTARIVAEFFGALGSGFGPYLDGGVPDVPVDSGREIDQGLRAAAAPAGRYATAPPVLYERALLAAMQGHGSEALRDLELLLDAYPGFLQGAVHAAKLALADGQAERVIWWLAPVEFEANHTREGAGLLADALRAIGRHADASRYDRTMLANSGHHDSRGNDCAPVDVSESPVADRRMPLPYSLQWIDARLLANERGNYYLAAAHLSGLHLADLLKGQSVAASVTEQSSASPPVRSRLRGLRSMAARVGRFTVARAGASSRPSAIAPPPAGAGTVQAAATVPDFEVLGPDQRVQAGRERLEAGLARIFGQDLQRGAGVVRGPYLRAPDGWTALVVRPPAIWTGAQYCLFHEGRLLGSSALSPDHRIQIGGGDAPIEEVRDLNISVVAAEVRTLELPFTHVDSLCWMAGVPDLAFIADRMGDGTRSSISILEDGRLLRHPHAIHSDIARLGDGRFSHWENVLYFSTTDDSDPNRNGRSYTLLLTSLADAVENRLLNSRTTARRAFRRVTGPFRRSKEGWVGLLPNPPHLWDGTGLQLLVNGEIAGAATLLGADQVCIGMLDRDREHVLGLVLHVFAAEERLIERPFAEVRGLMWAVAVADLAGFADNMDAPDRSSLAVHEDDQPLRFAHAYHDEIAAEGRGRYSHWNETLYFSSLDGSDPNTNGRSYRLLITRTDQDALQGDDQDAER